MQATPPSSHCASLVCSTNTITCTHPHKTDNNTNTPHKAGNLNKRQASKLRQALQANTTLTALKYDGQHQYHHHVCAPQVKASSKAWQQQTGSRSGNVNGQVLGELVAELTALTTLSVGCEPHQQPQQTLAMDTLWCAGVLATDASQVQPLVAALQHNTNLQRLRLWRWCTTPHSSHTQTHKAPLGGVCAGPALDNNEMRAMATALRQNTTLTSLKVVGANLVHNNTTPHQQHNSNKRKTSRVGRPPGKGQGRTACGGAGGQKLAHFTPPAR